MKPSNLHGAILGDLGSWQKCDPGSQPGRVEPMKIILTPYLLFQSSISTL